MTRSARPVGTVGSTKEAGRRTSDPARAKPGRSKLPDLFRVPTLAPTVRGERTRRRIVSAAEELFRSASSYEHIGVADIAQASNSSVGSIYRYFESKEDLLHLILSNAFWRMYSASRGTWNPEDSALVNIERATRAYLEAFWEERALLRLARGLIGTSDTVRDLWWSINQDLRERMRSRLEQDQAAAGAPALDSELMIRCLINMVDGYATRAFIDGEYGRVSKKDIPQIASVVAHVWFRAVWASAAGG